MNANRYSSWARLLTDPNFGLVRGLDQAGRDCHRRRINPVAAEGHDASGKPKTRLVGDLAYAEAAEVAGAITSVPGGVGRMTMAMMANIALAAQRAAGV